MRIAIESFRGEAPRLTPRALPDNAAQVAINSRLQSGDLETWRGFLETKTLQNNAVTIYRLNGEWLSWESDVDVARGPIPGDTTFRTYLTGPDEYSEPRFTTFALATTGSEPYPVATRPLGVPAPDSEPTLVVSVDPVNAISVSDDGGSLTTWTTSPTVNSGGVRSEVAQSAILGNPAPSYSLAWENNAGSPAFMYRDFGVENSAAVSIELDFRFTSGDDGYQQLIVHLANTETGVGLGVSYDSDSDVLGLVLTSGWTSFGASAFADENIGSLNFDEWYHLSMSLSFNSNGTKTATASIYQGSGLIGTVSGTASFVTGGYCGFVAEGTTVDALDEFRTFFDNIEVSGSGDNDPTVTASSYVYTFVNDLGEESAPSPASATVRRPDGVTVTVTTATVVPSGISSEYGITTKRIYRSETGNTGTVFRFVAEIPLATETYDDSLTVVQLGEVLTSENFDLPPDDLHGIRALPNGVLAGFSKNQLCLSAQNRPHAWPVGNRLTVDTNIVAIEAIDTTVVIGTEASPYTASGNDPSAYSMSKPGLPQACVAKPSMRYVNDDIGVLFASPDGLMSMVGPNRVRNITENVFTRRQWQDLQPETIRAVVHDDTYIFTYGGASSGSGGTYMLDLKPNGFGLVRLDFLTTAMFSDPLTDKLYMVREDTTVETVLFLFHMTETATPEGLAEFTSVQAAMDQTGATWGAGTANRVLASSSPAPKFGALSLGSSAEVTWIRDIPQATAPDDYNTESASALQIDMWAYHDDENGEAGIEIGVNSYPFNSTFRIRVGAAGYVTHGFESADEESYAESFDPIAADEWTHLRLLCVGNVIRLYINGVQDATAQVTTVDEAPIAEAGPINRMQLQFSGSGKYLDDCRAILNGSTSTDDFTPPVAPWPNP